MVLERALFVMNKVKIVDLTGSNDHFPEALGTGGGVEHDTFDHGTAASILLISRRMHEIG